MIIIHGNKNQGKTTKIKKLLTQLVADKKTVAGFYSEKKLQNNNIIGYDLITLPSKESFSFLRLHGLENQDKIGSYYINEFALAEGVVQIKKGIINQTNYVIIDEIGKLELNNKGWYVALNRLLTNYSGEIILSVRTEFVKAVIEKWQLKNVQLIDVSN